MVVYSTASEYAYTSTEVRSNSRRTAAEKYENYHSQCFLSFEPRGRTKLHRLLEVIPISILGIMQKFCQRIKNLISNCADLSDNSTKLCSTAACLSLHSVSWTSLTKPDGATIALYASPNASPGQSLAFLFDMRLPRRKHLRSQLAFASGD